VTALLLMLALTQAPDPAAQLEAEEAKQRKLLDVEGARDKQRAKEVAEWKAGTASKTWGPTVDEADEVIGGDVTLAPFVQPVKFHPAKWARALTAAERKELKNMLDQGVFRRTPPPQTACGFNPAFGLFWKKGTARVSATFCFDCCQVISDGVAINDFDCAAVRAWAARVLKAK
jgi:hypothetical protein